MGERNRQQNNASGLQAQGGSGVDGGAVLGFGGNFGGLDALAAKQMAALQATSLAKAGNRSAPGGTSVAYFGGLMTPQSQTARLPNAALSLQQPSPSLQHQPGLLQPPGLPPDLSQPHPPNTYMAHPNPNIAMQHMQHMHKRRQFLGGLATIHTRNNNPLPPELVGAPWPQGYDPSNSPWRPLEISRTELGVIRLAGKDVDLYKLWALVLQGGGGSKVNQQGLWPAILRQLDLPEQFSEPQPHGQQSVAPILARYYLHIIGPFEEAYRRNLREQQMRAAAQQGGQQIPGNPQLPGGMPDGIPGASNMGAISGMSSDSSINLAGMGQPVPSASSQMLDSAVPNRMSPTNSSHTPQLVQHPPVAGLNSASGMSASSSISQHMTRSTSSIGGNPVVGSELNGPDADQDANSRKRKLGEAEDLDSKRVRQKTEPPDMQPSAPPSGSQNGHRLQSPVATRIIKQPSRRKIEYVPLARDVDTTGGRDLDAIQHELLRASHRPLKDMNDWGQVDVDALTMSMRSRLATELSYALTTFTMLSLMKYPHKDPGFPIQQAPDLLEEALDLLEDIALDGAKDDGSISPAPQERICTHRELVNGLIDEGSRPFASLQPKQGWKDAKMGPRPRTGETVLAVMNIIRNLSNMSDNQEYLAKHDRLLNIVLRLCALAPSSDPHSLPSPVCKVLSLQDLLTLRKDVVHILVNIAGIISFSSATPPPKQDLLNARRAFELLSSFMIDPVEAVSPFAAMIMSGIAPSVHHPRPPGLADTTLEAFTRLFQPDDNRRLLSGAVSQEWLWTLLESLVHRLPVSDHDYQVVMRDVWLGFVEKLVMAIYALAFLAPPQLKKRIKTDRSLAFTKVLLRLVKKFSIYSPPEARMYFIISVRRAIEAMRLVDDSEDSFDTAQTPSGTTLMFGMGYGEHGETRPERGMGLLSGYQDEITWNLMLQREVAGDELMFTELESLVRVDKTASALPIS